MGPMPASIPVSDFSSLSLQGSFRNEGGRVAVGRSRYFTSGHQRGSAHILSSALVISDRPPSSPSIALLPTTLSSSLLLRQIASSLATAVGMSSWPRFPCRIASAAAIVGAALTVLAVPVVNDVADAQGSCEPSRSDVQELSPTAPCPPGSLRSSTPCSTTSSLLVRLNARTNEYEYFRNTVVNRF